MKSNTPIPFLAAIILFAAASAIPAFAQTSLLKRTTYKTQSVEAGPAMTLSLIGAPEGSIRIEGWKEREMEVSAEIEVRAGSSADLDELAKVTGFAIDEGPTKISVVTVGPHDKKYLKKVAKKFPKRLRNSPFKVNYTVKVPFYTDLDINGGKGALAIAGVEGAMRVNFLESDADLLFTGGSVQVTIGAGDVTVTLAKPSWRGRFAEVQVSSGKLNVRMPKDMNANITAQVLRTGEIENKFGKMKPERWTKFTDTHMEAIAGHGGASMKFTVGDGTLLFSNLSKPALAEKQ